MRVRLNVPKILFYLIYICITISALAGMWGNIKIPPLFEIAMLCLACWYVRFISDKIGGKAKQLSIVFIVVYFIAFIILIVYHSDVMPTSMFIAIGSLMMIHIGILQKQFSCPAGMYIIIVISSFIFEGAFYFTDEVYYGTARTLASWNPQSVGMWAYALGASLFVLADRTRNIKLKIFLYAHFAFMCYSSVITETRTVIVTFAVLIITRILPVIKVLTHKWLAAAMACIPAVVGICGALSNFNLFNGRERIWRLYLDLAMKSPVIGRYTEYHSAYTHNIFVDQSLYFGFVFAIFFMVLLGALLFNSSKYIKSRSQYTGYMAAIGIMLVSALEGAIFSGGCGGIFVYAFFCIYMIKSDDVKTANMKKKKVLVW